MAEYSADIPLWDHEGHLGDDPARLTGELGLSPELIADLRDWQRDWEAIHPTWWLRGRLFDLGHRRRGSALVARLNAAAGTGIAYRLG
jgi:hypothetical protein